MFDIMTKRRSGGRERPLKVGEVVEIRPLEEILATLDEKGQVDGMPFMPEMAAYCGQRATVEKRAHKTCDGHGNLRWLDDTVHLDGLRCNGSSHGGCQAKCLMYWKTQWLRPVTDADSRSSDPESASTVDYDTILGPTSRQQPDGTLRYSCQATEVNAASRPLPVWEPRQYVWDLTSRNWSLRKFARVMLKAVVNRYQKWSVSHLPKRFLIHEGKTFHHVRGEGTKTPRRSLDLEIGEQVRVRPLAEIEKTLNRWNTNRGLLFDAETATWCGSPGTVVDRVERLIDDQTGEMIEIKSDCVILDGKVCRGEYWRLCSRSGYDFWREIWLERENDLGHR